MTAPELQFPLPAQDFLPQQPPMRFIDLAIAIDDRGAVSETTVAADSIALDPAGGFPALALIEVMAQTIGLFSGRAARLKGSDPRIGLLLGTRRMELPLDRFSPGDVLRCTVEKTFESDEGLWQFECAVRLVKTAAGEVCDEPAGTATLNVYNPPEGYFDR